MIAKLHLFSSPSAFPNPQRLRLFMHEKGSADQFEERIYDMTPGGEQRQQKNRGSAEQLHVRQNVQH